MESAELVLALFIAVAARVTIARRVGIAYPIFLMIGGLVLGLVPGIPRVRIEPDVILLIRPWIEALLMPASIGDSSAIGSGRERSAAVAAKP